jgi:long-chain fatty acid transport protein
MKLKSDVQFPLGLALLAAVLVLPSRILANGFLLPDQDAFATARGEAVVATADNASAIYYNPAGIAQLQGNNFRAGVYGVYLDPTYTRPGGSQTFHNQDKLHAAGHMYYTYGAENCPVVLGLGIYAPFGLGVEWPQDSGFRTVGTQAELIYSTINPVLAFQLAPNFMIGGGIMVNYANADLRQGLFSPNRPVDEFRFVGEGWGVGYNLGALWKPHELVSLGATFRSGTDIRLGGHTDAFNVSAPFPAFSQRVSAQTDLPIPLQAIFGVSYRPTPDWNLEFDANYTDWGAVDMLTIHQPASVALPTDVVLPLQWHPSWLYEFGATRYFSNGWHVSAGYVFNENSMPDSHYTPLVADLNRHFFSVGGGFKGSRLSFDMAYQFGYGPSRTVSGSAPSLVGQTADGNYEYFSHVLLMTVGVRF